MGAAAIFALAMLAVGFAHKPLQWTPAATALELAALPDGSLPDLCLASDGGSAPAHAASRGCDACLLTSAPGLAASQADFSIARDFSTPAYAFPVLETFCGRFTGTATARGPPQHLTSTI